MLAPGTSPTLARAPRTVATDLARYTLAEYGDANVAWLTADGREAPCASTESDECTEGSAPRIPAIRRLARTVASVFL